MLDYKLRLVVVNLAWLFKQVQQKHCLAIEAVLNLLYWKFLWRISEWTFKSLLLFVILMLGDGGKNSPLDFTCTIYKSEQMLLFSSSPKYPNIPGATRMWTSILTWKAGDPVSQEPGQFTQQGFVSTCS